MANQENRISSFNLNVYAFYGVFQNWGFWVPFLYGQMYMTNYLGIPIAITATILSVAKLIDFCFSVVAGGIVQSANLKKGKFLPWMKTLRFVIATGAILQMMPVTIVGSWPIGLKAAIVAVGYCMMHCSMNFMATCQYGVMPLLAGSNMDDRIKMTTRQTQVNSASSIILSFGTVPLITLVGKLVGNEAMGYTIVTAVCTLFLITGVQLMDKAVGPLDKPRDPSLPAPPKVKVKDMVAAIFTNDQMIIYMLYQVVNQTGTYIVSGMAMYYWQVVMNQWGLYSIATGITTCLGFVFAMFIPAIGKKLGKKKAILANTAVLVLAKVVMATMGLKSIWWMAAATALQSAGMYLTMAFGVNYYLDIGEYGYYKTGKDFRTLSMSMMNIPMKISMALGGAIGGYVLAWIGFDGWNAQYMAGTLDRTLAEFEAFRKTFMVIYAFVPAAFAVVAVAIFMFGYKITDEDAKFYAQENAKKMAAQM
ncbi:MAG: MFS transporter [Eubacteriaceae bacterium]|nr:MFS transporter [Eubacteriaceae bacterium]